MGINILNSSDKGLVSRIYKEPSKFDKEKK
jgi:hypothetical protein